MRLPLSHSLRNLRRRPWRSLMTAVGVAVVVFAAALMLALSRGLFQRLEATGSDENLLLISRKGRDVMFSDIKEEELQVLWSMPNLAKDADGQGLISPELMHGSFVRTAGQSEGELASIRIRGVTEAALGVHRNLRIIKGRFLEQPFDILVGAAAHAKLGVAAEKLRPGNSITFEGRDWTICGVFSARESLTESELWVHSADLRNVLRRRTHSFVVARFDSAAHARDATGLFRKTGAIEKHFKGWPERDYYRQYAKELSWVFWLSLFMVALVTIAGVLIGVNTMYTVIISRMDEIATQRVLGFSRLDILRSLLVESVLIALLGGLIGAGASLSANNVPMNLSYGVFYLRVDAAVAAVAVGLAVVIGLLGGLLPACKGLRLSIVEAMRYE